MCVFALCDRGVWWRVQMVVWFLPLASCDRRVLISHPGRPYVALFPSMRLFYPQFFKLCHHRGSSFEVCDRTSLVVHKWSPTYVLHGPCDRVSLARVFWSSLHHAIAVCSLLSRMSTGLLGFLVSMVTPWGLMIILRIYPSTL